MNLEFLYYILVTLLDPVSFCVILLFISFGFRKQKVWSRICLWAAVATVLVCGNGWVVQGLVRSLERRHLPANPVPQADCILVLSGGIQPRVPPRPTVEIGEAGDRVLYGAILYRQGRAPHIICTGDVATGDISSHPASVDMAELLEALGVPKDAIITESQARNTHEHATYLATLQREYQFRHVLLVTSAMHMPRSLGVFKRLCPGIEFTAAPTDFHCPDRIPVPWYRELVSLMPTPGNLLDFSAAMHEYFGIAYYRMRGWM